MNRLYRSRRVIFTPLERIEIRVSMAAAVADVVAEPSGELLFTGEPFGEVVVVVVDVRVRGVLHGQNVSPSPPYRSFKMRKASPAAKVREAARMVYAYRVSRSSN